MESPGFLRWNVRESNASIARKLGVSEETVARRTARIQRAGVLQGFQLIVNPNLLGLRMRSVELEVRDSQTKERAISQLKLVEGVVAILAFHDKEAQVTFYY